MVAVYCQNPLAKIERVGGYRIQPHRYRKKVKIVHVCVYGVRDDVNMRMYLPYQLVTSEVDPFAIGLSLCGGEAVYIGVLCENVRCASGNRLCLCKIQSTCFLGIWEFDSRKVRIRFLLCFDGYGRIQAEYRERLNGKTVSDSVHRSGDES